MRSLITAHVSLRRCGGLIAAIRLWYLHTEFSILINNYTVMHVTDFMHILYQLMILCACHRNMFVTQTFTHVNVTSLHPVERNIHTSCCMLPARQTLTHKAWSSTHLVD